jgi:hypothetical protein
VSSDKSDVSVHVMTAEEAWDAFDERARQNLNMSGDDFVRAWRSGSIGNPDRPETMDVLMLMPLEW